MKAIFLSIVVGLSVWAYVDLVWKNRVLFMNLQATFEALQECSSNRAFAGK